MRYLRNIVLLVLSVVAVASCSMKEEPDYREQDYGHVQFKLYKAASYEAQPEVTKAVMTQLEYLKDVTKIKVTLRYEGNIISQTLVMTAANDDAAEFGLRSDKLKLLAGRYDVLTFCLYDKVDELIYEGTPSSAQSAFDVVPGGLSVHDLLADVVERGKVRFTFVKDLSDFNSNPMVKAPVRSYTFDEITAVTVSVRSEAGVKTVFEELPVVFSMHFDETDDVEDGYMTSSLQCDTLLSLTAGKYSVESYEIFDGNNSLIELNTRVDAEFEVSDNQVTDTDVPVKLYESEEFIKDYYALYEIWKSLHGEEWRYVGEDYPAGCNWDFNKDVDLWGDQPGVSLHSNGRVALINISGFGFYGDMSPALGQLTELVELYLGTHNDSNLLHHDETVAPGKGTANRMERHKSYLSELHPATQMGEPIARALAENNIVIPETALYQSMQESDILDPATGRMRIQPMDLVHGKLCNGLTSLPAEIGNLTKLEQIFIANGELTELPAEMANLESCTDLELYNCPKMVKFPMVLAKMPSLITANLANNSQWSSEEVLAGLKALATGASAEKIQLLYFNENNLEVLPKELKNMKKLGLLDFASNKIHTIEEAWGNDIKPVQLYLDNNRLSSFPVDENGVFCFMDDAETFSVRNNRFTEFPDIFDANSLYTINSIDFSYNEISGFQNGENFKGLKVNTLTLANNPPMTKYPIEIAKSNSSVAYVNVRGCNIDEIPDGSFEYENSIYLTSLDLSYNDLDDLPWDLHAGNLPYLYGVELSYNKFKEFPWEPLDSQYLTVFAIRGQRDDAGARCLADWPEGIYQHRGLRGFYIGSNNLGKIEDTISTICYYLDISDNPEIVFDASDICYAIQAGAYILIYDQTQNIKNCPVLFY
ncbi:MAG: DUF4458 domain-containing protein [Bacteroidales bacterium]|nr:DUF4458 domain-containing protein [Bacteroidales bacterium]